MNANGPRRHLIERSGLQLDEVVRGFELPPPAGAAAANQPGRGFSAPSPDSEQPIRSLGDHPAVIERAALERAGMIDWQRSGSRAAEEFRIALTEILRQIVGADRPAAGSELIMITSALPGEGKSFTALNLAVGIARHGERRVLLVDGDGRRGGLGDLLQPPGALDAAAALNGGGRHPATLGARTCIANLDFLRLGDGTHSADAASGGMLEAIETIARLREDRVVLIDAPPCLSSSHPHLLAPLVSQAVLVVAAGSTQQGDIEAALGMIRSCPGVSLLLNRVGRWQSHPFGWYGATA